MGKILQLRCKSYATRSISLRSTRSSTALQFNGGTRRCHPPSSRTKSQSPNNRLYLEPLRFETQKGSALHRPVWVVRPHVLRRAIEEQAWSAIFSLGSPSYVTGSPCMGHVYVLQPPISTLPVSLHASSPIDAEGEDVFVSFFRIFTSRGLRLQHLCCAR